MYNRFRIPKLQQMLVITYDVNRSNKPVPNTNVNISTTTTDVRMNNKIVINPSQQSFMFHYIDQILILVECTDSHKKLGNWHPFKAVRFFFLIIFLVSPTWNRLVSKKLKFYLSPIVNGHNYSNSNFWAEHGFLASIQSTLICSFGMIKLDGSVSEEEIWERLRTPVLVETFKRILLLKKRQFYTYSQSWTQSFGPKTTKLYIFV